MTNNLVNLNPSRDGYWIGPLPFLWATARPVVTNVLTYSGRPGTSMDPTCAMANVHGTRSRLALVVWS